MMRMLLSRSARLARYCLLSLSGLLAALPMAASAGDPVLPLLSPHQTIGTVNCASSTCHGSITPWEGSNVLQNEYTTWSRLDRHTRSYEVLKNKESQRIVRNLGYKEPATEVKICLDCHAHNPPPALRGDRFTQSEGIGCEGCHGPAADWISEHAVKGTPHSANIERGLYPTNQPIAQAKLCLSCHFGDESRFVTHRIMGAGHPRISFELKTFSALEPAHYRVDADYEQRKGSYDSVRLWAIGQALAARQQLDTLADPKRGRDGLMPELVLFDCHSCHHPMSDKQWTPRLGVGPGRIRLNDSNLLMLRAIVRATYPESSAAFDKAVRATHLAVSTGQTEGGAAPLQVVSKLSATIGAYLPRLEQQAFPPALQRKVLVALIDESAETSYADYAGAEQAYMAIVTVSNDLLTHGALKSTPALTDALARLLKALRHDEQYDANVFRKQLSTLRSTVGVQERS